MNKKEELDYCDCGTTLKKDNETGLCKTCFNEKKEKEK